MGIELHRRALAMQLGEASRWYASQAWMRSKSTLRSSSGLKVTVGPASIAAIRSGAQATHVVRDWYLGETNALRSATKILKARALALSSANGDANMHAHRHVKRRKPST